LYLPGEVVERKGGIIRFRVGRGNMVITLKEEDVISIREDGIEVSKEATDRNPWLRLADLVKEARDYFMARRTPEGVETVMRVKDLGDGTFLGYRVVLSGGEVVRVLDAGKYRRYSAPGLEEFWELLPAEKVAGASSLSEEELGTLADRTPAKMLPKIAEYDGALALTLALKKFERDFLFLRELGEDEKEKLREVARKYWSLAAPEAHPAIVRMFLAELRALAPTETPEYEFVRQRLEDEEREDQQLEKAKEEARKRAEEARKAEEARREEARRGEAGSVARMVLGMLGVVPIVVTNTLVAASAATAVAKAAREASVKARRGVPVSA